MKKKNEITWVHISDIHFGHTNYVEGAFRDDLPNYLQNLKDKYIFDFLFITGDLVYAKKYANPTFKGDDIMKIGATIKRIQDSVGVDNEHTYIAIGNHDVVRLQEKDEIIKGILKNGYTSEEDELSEQLDNISGVEQRFATLYQKILGRDYKYGHFLSKAKVLNKEDENEIEVLNVDTTITAEAMDGGKRLLQDGNLLIGLKALRDALSEHEAGHPIIAIGHHPIGSFNEDDRLYMINELQRVGVRLYLCGHTHRANIQLYKGHDGRRAPIIQVCCGTNMERLENGSKADMTFFVGGMDLDNKSCFIETHEYMYNSQKGMEWRVSDIAPFERHEIEKILKQTTYYYPLKKAPYYMLVGKYVNTMQSLIEKDKFYIDPIVEEDSRHKPGTSENNIKRNVYEANVGFGKSCLLRNLVRNNLKAEANQDIQDNILQDNIKYPFYINLEVGNKRNRALNSIYSLLAQSIHLKPDDSLFAQWTDYIIHNNKLVLLIDGVDRLNKEERQIFFVELAQFCEQNSSVEIHIASKYFAFQGQEIENKYRQFTFYQILPFDEVKIREYCKKWLENDANEENKNNGNIVDDKIDELATNLTAQIINDPAIKDLARVPLLLNIIMQVSQKTNTIPRNRIQLYDSFARALLQNSGNDIESDLRILAAIAYKMTKERTTSIQEKTLKGFIYDIMCTCDWFCNRGTESACDFLSRIYTRSGLLLKVSDSGNEQVAFYNPAIQEYFAAMAIAKGWYLELNEEINQKYDKGTIEKALIKAVEPFLTNQYWENLLELAILQFNSYQTYLVVCKIIEQINEPKIAASMIISSYLRNILLRIILDGAFISKEQRGNAFEAVQVNGLFSLQADLLWEVWNSAYKSEFSDKCTQYIVAMYTLLENTDNPLRTLYTEITSEIATRKDFKKLDEKLYVFDGIVWSNGRKYINSFLYTNDIDDLVNMLESIWDSDQIDALCKRRACGVLQRLVTIGSVKEIRSTWIAPIFSTYLTVPRVAYRCESDLSDDQYAGIRIFRTIALDDSSISFIKKMKFSAETQKCYETLYSAANNVQDRLDAFQAAILCKCWHSSKIHDLIKRDEVFKTSQVDMSAFSTWVDRLDEQGYFAE